MQVLLDIPDELSQWMTRNGKNATRTTIEALAIEAYRSGAFSEAETRSLLGFETRYEFDEFLKTHGVEEGAYDLEDLEQDRRALASLQP